MLAESRDAEERENAEKASGDFAATYGAKYRKAVAKLTHDQKQLFAFYEFRPSTGCSSRRPARWSPLFQ